MYPVSVLYPMQPSHPDAVARYARTAIRAGAARMWMGQSLAAESHQVLAYLAGMGIRPPVGLSVTLTALRHPFEAAVQARSLALVTRQPVVVGYGAASPPFVAGLRGAPYRRPAAAVAGYVSAVRGLLDGPALRHACEACTVHAALPAVPHPAVELGVGVLRPAMARAAGAVADVAITWLTPPAYLRDVLLPALAAGAANHRPMPRVTTVVQVALARPGRDPGRLALAGSGAHLKEAHYTDMLRRAGIRTDPADPRSGARALVDAGVFAYGTAAEVAERLLAYRAAGVDEVVLSTAGLALIDGDAAALADLIDIIAAVRDRGLVSLVD